MDTIKSFDTIIVDQSFDELKIPQIKVELADDNNELICLKTPQDKIVVNNNSDGCISSQCQIENNYGCTDSNKYFKVDNLFSELTTDYQRAVIRQNLGIGDLQSLLWGKIQGNLANQKDLYNFVKEVAQADSNKIIESVNLQLQYWSNNIQNMLESKAGNITSMLLRPMYGSTMETPIDVLVSWEYAYEVEAQKINGYEIQPSTRNFLIQGVTESKDITLSYYLDDVWLSRTITFTVYAPTYYGTSENYNECQQTINDKFTVEAIEGEYIYVFTSTPSNLAVNNLIGGFEECGTTFINAQRYFIYKSANSGLGRTTIQRYDIE